MNGRSASRLTSELTVRTDRGAGWARALLLLSAGAFWACGGPSQPVAESASAAKVSPQVAAKPTEGAAAASTAEVAAHPEVVKRSVAGRPVVFVGLDGADWQLLDQLIADGTMPQLGALVAEGTRGVLETEHPPLSPLLWTTMMTGQSPLAHGILDFVHTVADPAAPDRGGRLKEPITSDERRVPAVWNMASWGGKRVAVLGMWATFPAEPVAGLLVADRLFSFLFHERETPAGAVWPPDRAGEAAAAVARAEAAVDFAAVRVYLPWLDREQYARDTAADDPYANPVGALRRILVETAVYDDLATRVLTVDRPDLAVIYLQGSDSIGHVFAPFVPPRQASIEAADVERYGAVARAYFAALDRLLGRYRELAKSRGAVLFLASDHGFLWGEGRPTSLSSFATTTAAKWHRRDGIYLLAGPGIAPAAQAGAAAARMEDAAAPRGGIRRVAATLLALLGLPPGRDLAGPPLPGTPVGAVTAAPFDYAALFERQAPRVLSAKEAAGAREELAKLQALGYLGAGDLAAPTGAATTSRTPGSFNNEGLIRKEQGDLPGAIAAFEQAIALDAKSSSALWNLSDLLHGRGTDLQRSDRLLLDAMVAGLADAERFVVGRAIGYQRSGDLPRATRLLDGAVAARPESPVLWLFRGRYRIERGDCAGALTDFEQAILLDQGKAEAHASAGLAASCLGRGELAAGFFERSLELDPNQPQLRAALAAM